jgi:phosphomannomutase / phosphoglucomutase
MTNKFPPASIFRAYDIRGIVDKTLTEDNVYLIGKGFGSLVLEQGEETAVIARDGRLSGPRFAYALSEGIRSSGCHVIDLGSVPTPLLYFATHVLSVRSGVMLTGSHNPPDYNGLKMVLSQQALAEERIVNLLVIILK